MPFLKQQVQIINKLIRATSLSDKRFQSGRYESLAVDVSEKDGEKVKTFPAIMNSNYEAVPVSVDDTFPIIIYHKIVSKTNVPVPDSGYGDGNKGRKERADMRMVVYGKYAKLQMTQEELEALITMNFPDQIAKAEISGLKLDAMLVQWNSSNMNGLQVFNQEYRGIEPFLAPEDIFFSISYSIECRYRKGCFTITDCESNVN